LLLEIDGVTASDVKAWYRYGVLTLYTGEDPNNSVGQAVRFWNLPNAPEEKVLRYPNKEASTFGRISYEANDPKDRSLNIRDKQLKDPHFELALSMPDAYAVKVAIDLQADAPLHVRARGTISAMTRGLKMVNGEVDRTFDHLDTIQYLTRTWIEKHHAPKQIADAADYCMMTRGATPNTAACSFLLLDSRGALSTDAKGAFHISRTLGTSERFDARSQTVMPREPRQECQKTTSRSASQARR
jgi:hypothetical protein